jgi:hypothetical protein
LKAAGKFSELGQFFTSSPAVMWSAGSTRTREPLQTRCGPKKNSRRSATMRSTFLILRGGLWLRFAGQLRLTQGVERLVVDVAARVDAVGILELADGLLCLGSHDPIDRPRVEPFLLQCLLNRSNSFRRERRHGLHVHVFGLCGRMRQRYVQTGRNPTGCQGECGAATICSRRTFKSSARIDCIPHKVRPLLQCGGQGANPPTLAAARAIPPAYSAMHFCGHSLADRAKGCRLPLNIRFLPLPVDPTSKAMACPLRSTGITPLHHYKETTSSAGPPLAGSGCECHIVAKVSQAFD